MGLDALVPQEAEVPFGEVGLGAVSADADQVDLVGDGVLDVIDRGPPRQQEDAQFAVRQGFPGDRQHLVIAEPGPADLKGGGPQAVAVADLDHRNARGVRGLRVGAQLVGAEVMPDGVVAVAQTRIVDLDRPGREHVPARLLAHDISMPAIESRSAA